MSFEIAAIGANGVNTRPDIALLQANATNELAKFLFFKQKAAYEMIW